MNTALAVLEEGASLRGLQVFARRCSHPVFAFLGIPYAEPPKRFAPPQPLRMWRGERDATKFGAICPQNLKALRVTYFPYPVPDDIPTNENCFFLNIWTPTLSRSARLPVMVWFYGGAYLNGFSNYFDGTAYAALQNVVFVSFNYRVGILGFLSTGDGEVVGNMAMLDQREALRWVQKYIQCFGGDPNNVTVFGESAGALSISCHLVSRGSQGLFHRAILQSGSMCYSNSAITQEIAYRRVRQLVKKLGGVEINEGKDIVNFIQGHHLKDLIMKPPFSLIFPIIDGDVLVDDPSSLLSSGQFAKLDVIFGFNNDEGIPFTKDLIRLFPAEMTVDHAKRLLKVIICHRYFSRHPKALQIYEIVWKEYFQNVEDATTLEQRLTEVYGDVLFIAPTFHNAVLHSGNSTGHNISTYLYHFNHRPSFSTNPDWISASHGQDVPFVIGEPFLERLPDIWSEEERQLSSTIMTMWSNFARNGNPNADTVSFQWPKFDSSNLHYAVLDTPCSSHSNYRPKRMNFWLTGLWQQLTTDSKL